MMPILPAAKSSPQVGPLSVLSLSGARCCAQMFRYSVSALTSAVLPVMFAVSLPMAPFIRWLPSAQMPGWTVKPRQPWQSPANVNPLMPWPSLLMACASDRICAYVVGGLSGSRPACLNSDLLYQSTDRSPQYGTPYCLPWYAARPMCPGESAALYGSLLISAVRSMNDPLRENVGTSMSFSPSTSGGSPALIEGASDVTSSLMDVSVSLTCRFLWDALNSLTSFWASVLDTVRAQNVTVPVALVPNVLDCADGALDDRPEEEHPAAALLSSAMAAAPVSTRLFKSFIDRPSLDFQLLGMLGTTHWMTPYEAGPLSISMRSLVVVTEPNETWLNVLSAAW